MQEKLLNEVYEMKKQIDEESVQSMKIQKELLEVEKDRVAAEKERNKVEKERNDLLAQLILTLQK